MPLHVVEVARSTVLAAAHIKARFAISYADAFAVVTARDHGGLLMTGDPEFEPLVDAGVVRVAWLPRRATLLRPRQVIRPVRRRCHWW